jgi:hypothetical protein
VSAEVSVEVFSFVSLRSLCLCGELENMKLDDKYLLSMSECGLKK